MFTSGVNGGGGGGGGYLLTITPPGLFVCACTCCQSASLNLRITESATEIQRDHMQIVWDFTLYVNTCSYF